MKGNKSADRMRRVMDQRKSKVFDNDFDSGEQNEKGSRLDAVVAIYMFYHGVSSTSGSHNDWNDAYVL